MRSLELVAIRRGKKSKRCSGNDCEHTQSDDSIHAITSTARER
jgi:hypothetical protein